MLLSEAAADRPRWFALAFPLLALNGAVTLAAAAVHKHGWLSAALNLFEISAILWCAGAAGVALLLRAPIGAPLRRGDGVVLAVGVGAALLPFPVISAAALSLVAGWVVLTSPPATALRRAALIFLALTGSLLWGRLLLALGSGPLLQAESALVKAVTGLPGTGNTVSFAGEAGFFMVAPGCSSLQGVSLAVVLWVTVTQYFAVTVDARAWRILAACVAITIGCNVLRLSALALFPAHFDSLHVGLGATAFGWLALAGIVAVLWLGFRDALLARA